MEGEEEYCDKCEEVLKPTEWEWAETALGRVKVCHDCLEKIWDQIK